MLLQLLLDEEAWLVVATTSGLAGLLGLVVNQWRRHVLSWSTATSALNLFLALWIAIMGTGHLTAVTAKIILGTLPANVKLWIAIPFGLAIAVPGWWLMALVGGIAQNDHGARRRAMALNGWLALVLAVPAAPVAGFAGLNLALLAWKRKKKETTMQEASA